MSLIDSAVLVHRLRLPGNPALFFSKYASTETTEYGFVQHRCSSQYIKTDLLKRKEA